MAVCAASSVFRVCSQWLLSPSFSLCDGEEEDDWWGEGWLGIGAWRDGISRGDA